MRRVLALTSLLFLYSLPVQAPSFTVSPEDYRSLEHRKEERRQEETRHTDEELLTYIASLYGAAYDCTNAQPDLEGIDPGIRCFAQQYLNGGAPASTACLLGIADAADELNSRLSPLGDAMNRYRTE